MNSMNFLIHIYHNTDIVIRCNISSFYKLIDIIYIIDINIPISYIYTIIFPYNRRYMR